jgi:hypothetical protein
MFLFIKKLFQAKKPNAAIAWAAIENKAGNDAENAYWLYATPVHLILQRDSFSLSAPVPLPLESDEIDDLTAALNKNFYSDDKSTDNMQFFWHENTWFLRLQTNPNIETSAPELAIDQNIDAFAPTGEGAIKWASFINEVQMLLFAHPINVAREANKLPAINSVWCYGLGQIAIKNHAN